MSCQSDLYDEDHPDSEAVVEEFFKENPRARELHLLRSTLTVRRIHLRKEMALLPEGDAKERIAKQIRDINQQIAVLKEEEAISSFVEATIKMNLHLRPSDEYDED